MKRILEIRSAEGGDDAKLFAKDLAAAYIKLAGKLGWTTRLTEGECLSLEVTGSDLSELNNESGGHRIQRIPPTERRGRVHSSTVTVAVLDPLERKQVAFNDSEFKIEWYSGTGAGGQHRNKHQNSCRIVHLPTGEMATAQCRSRENSLEEAKATILARLATRSWQTQSSSRAEDRRNQVGSGERGDKRRTYRFQDDRTKDHLTGREASTTRVLQGNFDLLW